MNRIDRLTAILIQLQSKRVVKAQEIADRFGISLRTVYRDVRALEEAGIPLIGEAGLGYSLVEGYRLPPVMFTQAEAGALLLGAKLVEKLSDQSVQKEFQSAMYKIKAVLKLAEKDHLEQLEETTRVLRFPKPHVDIFPDNFLSDAQQAIVHRQVLRLDYFSGYNQAATQREVEPMGLLYYGSGWHLIAFCRLRRDYRDFRVDRIRNMHLTGQVFEKQATHSLETYLSRIARTENLHEVSVCFDNSVVRFIGEQKYYYGYVSETNRGDRVEMHFLTAYPEALGRWLLMFGNAVTIKQPTQLQELVRKLICELREHYR